jgi:DNA polymerase-3 subunit gamma/tau
MLPGIGPGETTPGRTQSLYRKHRPETFAEDDLVGQEHISRTLRNAIGRNRIAHAYLFCGPRGTGKTTTARLLAKAVNCLDPNPDARPCNRCTACVAITEGRATDMIEIDAASNRGIDDIRQLREQVRYAPAQLKTKVYIIDEAHQITKEGFNAFLKTLEEPPPHTIFVLATTDPDKLPDTIASRCQRFDFHRIPREQMLARMQAVCAREGIVIDSEALELIVRRATGSLRDALSLLDMLATAAGERADEEGESAGAERRVTVALARRMLGISDDGWEFDLVQALADRDVAAGLRVIGQAVDAGQDMRSFGRRVLDVLRLLMLTRAGANPVEANDRIRALAGRFELHELLRINTHFGELDFKIRTGGFPQLPLELALVASLVETVPARAEPPRVAAAPSGQPVTAFPPQPAPTAAPVPVERPRPPRTQYPEPTPLRSVERRAAPAPAADTRAARPARALAAGAGGDLDALVEVWERIRTEVKAVDRKAEALLASADPARIDGDVLTVVAAYPFHTSKLNEPKVRAIIEDAVERVTGRRLSASFVLREELDVGPPVLPAGYPSVQESAASWNGGYDAADPAPVTTVPAAVEPAADPEEVLFEQFVRTVKATFDAEETDPDDLTPPR